MEYEIFEELISEQFASKKNLIEPNLKALNIGRDYVLNNLPYPIGLTLERMDKNDGKILISGNEAAGLGAVYGGATICAWYPITPSTSLAEGFEKYAKKFRVDEKLEKTSMQAFKQRMNCLLLAWLSGPTGMELDHLLRPVVLEFH